MNAKRMLLAFGTAIAAAGLVSVPSAYAGKYPIKCQNNTAIVVDDRDAFQPKPFTGPTAIQDAVNFAQGSTTGTAGSGDSGSSGDTVIICKGTYHENVNVGLEDVDEDMNVTTNDNITIRSFDDTNEAVIIAKDSSIPVFTITAPGVTLGGPGLGLTITGEATTAVQVGVPGLDEELDQDDDRTIAECEVLQTGSPLECPDQELPAFKTTNVSIVGNRIKDVTTPAGRSFAGVAVNNTNNTLVFRNLIKDADVGSGQIAYGIVYADTNYNNQVLGNEVTDLAQAQSGACTGSRSNPAVGVVGVAFKGESLDSLIYDTKIDGLDAGCTAVGVFSNAWGGLENDRNGQQVPVVVDAVDNRIKDIDGADSDTAGIALSPAPNPEFQNDDKDESAPSSFRVMANDIDHTHTAVAVLSPLAAYSYIRENDLDAQVYGVFSTSTTTVDATNNWWGCQEGPASTKKECSKIGGGGDVTYNPWTKHHIDHAGAHAGEYAGHK